MDDKDNINNNDEEEQDFVDNNVEVEVRRCRAKLM